MATKTLFVFASLLIMLGAILLGISNLLRRNCIGIGVSLVIIGIILVFVACTKQKQTTSSVAEPQTYIVATPIIDQQPIIEPQRVEQPPSVFLYVREEEYVWTRN
ncbi:6738_t:CDS:2 [Paraglomus occultum]|uniref:6738_t:CDS:1 n=1 Tax=Paraglomus occultum TaxID=144539 RepID=A0A9N8Z9L8_9GLOM|nr:6738_t:CDS:2 [Paraglomus occultum]